jgi:hypothetical protein
VTAIGEADMAQGRLRAAWYGRRAAGEWTLLFSEEPLVCGQIRD